MLPILAPLLASLLAPVDALHRDWIPADAGSIVHVDVEHLLRSEIGRAVMEHTDGLGLDELEGFGQWVQELDLEPGRDLSGITVWAAAGEDAAPVAILSMSDAARRLFDRLPPEVQHVRTQVDGHVVHSVAAEDEELFAWIGEPVAGRHPVVFTPALDALFDALLVVEGEAPSLAGSDNPLAECLPQEGAYVFFATRDAGRLDHWGTTSNLLKQSARVVVQAGEHEGRFFVEAALGGKDADATANIADIAQGLLALARMVARNEDGASAEVREARLALLNAIDVTSEGGEIRVRFRIAAARLAAILRDNAEHLMEHGGR